MQATALISFPYDTTLVSLRREHAPRAFWLADAKAWRMTNVEASTFLAATGAALSACGSAAIVVVDGEPRRLGVPPAPVTMIGGHQVLPAPRNAAERAQMDAWCAAEAARLAKASWLAKQAAKAA